ncbi:uncharacterized protein [Palaemon carinicauda]|uniref:uncharacterized protein n=1 Tax=Palaemon carinicauda TaxID=392227 RepID=UPI0035B6A1A9
MSKPCKHLNNVSKENEDLNAEEDISIKQQKQFENTKDTQKILQKSRKRKTDADVEEDECSKPPKKQSRYNSEEQVKLKGRSKQAIKTCQEKNEGLKPTKEKNEGLKPTKEKNEGLKPTKEKNESLKPTKEKNEGLKPTKEKNEGLKPTRKSKISQTNEEDGKSVVVTRNEKNKAKQSETEIERTDGNLRRSSRRK